MSTEELQEVAWSAEDEGREVYVQRHDHTAVIEYIEIDGVETYNDAYVDEVKDAYWAENSYWAAEMSWRE